MLCALQWPGIPATWERNTTRLVVSDGDHDSIRVFINPALDQFNRALILKHIMQMRNRIMSMARMINSRRLNHDEIALLAILARLSQRPKSNLRHLHKRGLTLALRLLLTIDLVRKIRVIAEQA